jgi:signal transduction histidine kinase
MPTPLPLVLADGEKLYWALFQLLDNAIKFTPEGGEVTIQAALKEQHLRVSVRDTGIGIPRDQLNQIFQPFHQVIQSESIPVDGTGLGLALVKRIIEAHHSKVEVESEPSRGSVFFFELPIVVPR